MKTMDKIKVNLSDLRNSTGLTDLRHKLQQSRKLVLGVVFLALLLDNILLTAVGKWHIYIQISTLLQSFPKLKLSALSFYLLYFRPQREGKKRKREKSLITVKIL